MHPSTRRLATSRQAEGLSTAGLATLLRSGKQQAKAVKVPGGSPARSPVPRAMMRSASGVGPVALASYASEDVRASDGTHFPLEWVDDGRVHAFDRTSK